MMIDRGAPLSRVKHCTTKPLCTLHENTFGRFSSSVDLKRLAVSYWQNINNYVHVARQCLLLAWIVTVWFRIISGLNMCCVTFLQDFRPHLAKISLLERSWKLWMDQVLLLSYNTFQGANNKGTHQTSRMRRLVCAFVVHMWQSQVLSR